MQLLRIDDIEEHGPVAWFFGTVENQDIIVGQDVVVVSVDGQRDPGMITGIMPNYEGQKSFDQGAVGDPVKVVVRRKAPSFPNAQAASLCSAGSSD